jgi:hypothetical protein
MPVNAALTTVGTMSMSLEKSRLYLGESTTATVTLLTGAARVRNLNYPVLTADNVIVGQFSPSGQQEYLHEGGAATRYEFTARITPLDSGIINLGPVRLSGEVLETDGGAAGFFGETISQKISFETPQIHLTVLPLPTAGRPSDFTGVIGHLNMKVSVEPTSVSLGTPLTITTHINGFGNLLKVKCPEIKTQDFKSYPSQARLAGSVMSCTQVLIPQNMKATTIPPLRISFFNASTARYEYLQSAAIPLALIEKSSETQPVSVQQKLPEKSKYKQLNSIFAWWQALLAAMLAGVGIIFRHYAKIEKRSDVSLSVESIDSASPLYGEYFQAAELALSCNDVDLFYASAFRALEIIKNDQTVMNEDEISSLLTECDAVRYGCHRPTYQEMELLLDRMKILSVF